MSAFSAGFFHETNLTDLHPFIDRFTHIVDRKQCYGHSGQRLHFYTGLAGQFGCADAADGIRFLLRYKIYRNLGQHQRMT